MREEDALRFIIYYLLFMILLTSPVRAATVTSKANGAWSTGSTWDSDPAIPVNGDAVIVNHAVTDFDVDMSGWANGITLVINAGGTLKFATDGTVTHLKLQADITGTGAMYVGEEGDEIPLPAGAVPEVATIEFAGAYNIGGVLTTLEMHGEERTPWYNIASKTNNTTIVMEDGSEAGWLREGDIIIMSNSNTKGNFTPANETFTVDSYAHDGTKGTITLNAGTPLTRSVNQNDVIDAVAVISRNIKVYNSVAQNTTSHVFCDSAIDGAIIEGVNFYYLYAVIFSSPINWTFNYCSALDMNVSWSFSGSGGCHNTILSYCVLEDAALNGGYLFNTINAAISYCYLQNGGSYIYNSAYASNSLISHSLAHNTSRTGFCSLTGLNRINYCTSYSAEYGGLEYSGRNNVFYECTAKNSDFYGFVYYAEGSTYINCVNSGSDNSAAYRAFGCKFNNCSFGDAGDFDAYTGTNSPVHLTTESINHDQVENALKTTCKGGIVTSQTLDPPTGYSLYYEHACESADYPCFRQYQTTVLPGTAIEVEGKIRIYAGDDHSTNPPMLCLVDAFADPLIDDTQSYLDYDEVAEPDGDVEDDWQVVSVIWANSGDAPRQVIVRMFAQHASGDVDEVWSIADYQSQIQAIYDKLPTIDTIAVDVAGLDGEAMRGTDSANTTVPDAAGTAAGLHATTDGKIDDLQDAMDANFAAIDIDEGAIADEVVIHMDANSVDFNTIIATVNAIKAMTDLITILDTTVADDNDANSFTLTDGIDANYALDFHLIMVQDADDSHYEMRFNWYWSSDKVVVLDRPLSFTPAVGDVVHIMGTSYGGWLRDAVENGTTPPVVIDRRASAGGGGTTTLNAEDEDP